MKMKCDKHVNCGLLFSNWIIAFDDVFVWHWAHVYVTFSHVDFCFLFLCMLLLLLFWPFESRVCVTCAFEKETKSFIRDIYSCKWTNFPASNAYDTFSWFLFNIVQCQSLAKKVIPLNIKCIRYNVAWLIMWHHFSYHHSFASFYFFQFHRFDFFPVNFSGHWLLCVFVFALARISESILSCFFLSAFNLAKSFKFHGLVCINMLIQC